MELREIVSIGHASFAKRALEKFGGVRSGIALYNRKILPFFYAAEGFLKILLRQGTCV